MKKNLIILIIFILCIFIFKNLYTKDKTLINKNGNIITYHENGNICSESNYLNGKLDGEFKIYNENGKLMYHYSYKNGKLVD